MRQKAGHTSPKLPMRPPLPLYCTTFVRILQQSPTKLYIQKSSMLIACNRLPMTTKT